MLNIKRGAGLAPHLLTVAQEITADFAGVRHKQLSRRRVHRYSRTNRQNQRHCLKHLRENAQFVDHGLSRRFNRKSSRKPIALQIRKITKLEALTNVLFAQEI